MIQVLLDWAASSWHVIEARVALLTLARVGGPVSPLGLEPRLFLALVEGIAREAEHHSKALDGLYAAAAEPVLSAEEKRAARRSEIQRVSRLFGG